jgi:hypothetical protein
MERSIDSSGSSRIFILHDTRPPQHVHVLVTQGLPSGSHAVLILV